MATFIKAGFWEKLCIPCKGYKGWLNLDEFVESKVTASAYKVYTALLTQSGPDNPATTFDGGDPIIIGQTYEIVDNGGNGWDFTNIGAPNNNIGTFFVATGTTPANWGVNAQLDWNTATPVATVLENTIGNIWFTYNSFGIYDVNSDGLFTQNKTYLPTANIDISLIAGSEKFLFSGWTSENVLTLNNTDSDLVSTDDIGRGYLEIRVYN